MSRTPELSDIQIRLGAALAGTSSLKEGLRLCLGAAIEVSGFDCGGVYVVDDRARTARLAVHKNLSRAFVRRQSIHGPDSPLLAAVLQGKPIYSHSDSAFAKHHLPLSSPEREEALKAIAAIPILARKRVVACLNIGSHVRDRISVPSRRGLEAVAAQSGLAVLRLQAEAAVRQSEARYRKLISEASDPILVADAETGMILDGNAKALKLFGMSLAELRRRHQTQLHPPYEIETERKRFRAWASQKTPSIAEGWIRRKDGKDVPVEISACHIHAGGRHVMLGFFRDVTERKRAERTQARSREEMRRLTSRLAETEENERRRIARELHDEVGQALAGLGLYLNKIRDELPAGHTEALRGGLKTSVEQLEEITGRIRSVIADLRPPLLDEYGLAATLQWAAGELTRTTGLPVTTWIEDGFPRLSPPAEIAVVRIVGEALANVHRHARATRVVLSLESDGARAYLMVKDDGIGFVPERARRAAAGHWGLSIMRERAESVGGGFRIVSAPGAGTQVLVEVPL